MPFALTARTDPLLVSGKDGLAVAIRCANLYREAGADCLYAPGVSDLDTIKTLVREINGPINMVMGLGRAQGNAHEFVAAGVQRISLGGSIARSALGFVRRCADELREHGTLNFAEQQISQADLNTLFARSRAA